MILRFPVFFQRFVYLGSTTFPGFCEVELVSSRVESVFLYEVRSNDPMFPLLCVYCVGSRVSKVVYQRAMVIMPVLSPLSSLVHYR